MWTAVLRSDGQIRGSGAGYTPEEAVRVAAELLAAKRAARPS